MVLRENEKPASLPRWRRLPLLLYAIALTLAGLAIHLVGAFAFVLTETIAPGLLPAAWPGRLLVLIVGLAVPTLAVTGVVQWRRNRERA